LRLKLRCREKASYFVRQSSLVEPTAAEVWQAFADTAASNIEIRKAGDTAASVDVYKYYTAPTCEDALEVPKDSLGRLWDRLEENAITSWLFHTLVRRFGYHVELFLDEREFPIFWEAHSKLPLSKIQLRFARRDGLPHSPIGNRDCISADLFMRR